MGWPENGQRRIRVKPTLLSVVPDAEGLLGRIFAGVASERFDRLHPLQDGRQRLDRFPHFACQRPTALLCNHSRRLSGISRTLSGLTSELMLVAFSFSVGATALHVGIHSSSLNTQADDSYRNPSSPWAMFCIERRQATPLS